MKELFSLIADDLKLVNNQINDQLACSDKQIQSLVFYVAPESGKFIRPAVFLLSNLCFAKNDNLQIKVAAVLEMIHLATLLHDDVIDNAQQRRGKTTINAIDGNERAVLLGDYVLAQAIKLSNELGKSDIQNELASMTATICLGELSQNLNRGNYQLTEEQYIDIIAKKTASFFASSCKLAAIINNAEKSASASLEFFGLNLGIAFQIRDDIIDIIGSEAKFGKTLGTDLQKSKMTLPTIHFLQKSPSRKQELIENFNSMTAVNTLLASTQSIDYSKDRLTAYCKLALENLSDIPSCPAKDALVEITHSITNF